MTKQSLRMAITSGAVVVATAVAGCGTGRQDMSSAYPPAPPHTAQGMVQTWEAKRDAEVRCTRAESDAQIAKHAKNKTNPSCGNYKP